MFAHVYPLKRTPRRFTFFDYSIPDKLEVNIGDLVEIPFKQSNIFGIVGNIAKTSSIPRTRDIIRVVEPKLFTENDIQRIVCIADNIIQSPASIFYTIIGTYKDRVNEPKLHRSNEALSISTSIASFIKSTVPKLGNASYVQLSNEGEYALASIMRKKFDGQILLLFPRERDAEFIAEHLPLGDVAILHGKTTPVQRESTIKAWRHGSIKTLVGTRQAALLPAHNIEYIQVFDNASEDYRKLDRNPRIDARNAASLLAKQHGAQLVFTGVTPRLSLLQDKAMHHDTDPKPELVALQNPDQKTTIPFVSDTLMKAMYSALQSQKNVLLSFNRKGVADRIQCRACGHVPLCATCGSVPSVRKDDLVCPTCSAEMWIPEQCPACRQTKLTKKGIGNQELKAALQKEFADFRVGIVDKDHDESDADIILATEYFFKNTWHPFLKKRFGVLADLAIDQNFFGADFRNNETALYKLNRLIRIAEQQHATCIIQTWLPDLVKPLFEMETFLAKELETRKTYHLPPTVDRYTVKSAKTAAEYIEKTKNNQQDLSKRSDDCIIEPDLTYYDCSSSSPSSK